MAEFVNEKITVHVHSPLVLYGNSKPEIRASSIKGSMRWWLRALIGDIKKCKRVESLIWGSTERSAKIRIRTLEPFPGKIQVNDYQKKWHHKLFYFNYYIKEHMAFAEDTTFKISISSSNFLENEERYRDYFFKNLKVFSILGSLGARSRRGYGSISLSYSGRNQDIANSLIPIESVDDLKNEIKDIFSWLNNENSDLSFYNLNNASIFIGYRYNQVGFDSYFYALWDVVKKMQEMVRSKKELSGYFEIKSLIEEFIKENEIVTVPKELLIENAAFGFPLSYQSRTLKNKLHYANSVVINSVEFERIASPLFVKILKIGVKYYPLIIYFRNNLIRNDLALNLKFSKKNVDEYDSMEIEKKTELRFNIAENEKPKFVNRFIAQFEPIIN